MNTQNCLQEKITSTNNINATTSSITNASFTKKDLFDYLFAKNNILCYKSSFTNQIFFHVCEPTPDSKSFEMDFKNNNLSKNMVRVDIPDGEHEEIVKKYGNIFTTSFYLLYVFKINVGARDLEIVFDRSKFIDSNPMPELLNGDTVSINKKEYKNLIETIDNTRDLYSSSISSIGSIGFTDSINSNGTNNVNNINNNNIPSNNMFSGSLSPLNYAILSNSFEPFLAGVVVNDFIYFDNFPRIFISPHVKENLIEVIFSNRNGTFQKIWSKENSKENQNSTNEETNRLEFDSSTIVNFKKILDYYKNKLEIKEKLSQLNISASSFDTIPTDLNNSFNINQNAPLSTNTSEMNKINSEVNDNEVSEENEKNEKNEKNDEVSEVNEENSNEINEVNEKNNKINKENSNEVNNFAFDDNEKFHIKELLLAYEPYNEKMTDKIKFYYGTKLHNNVVLWKNNTPPVFIAPNFEPTYVKIVGFEGDFKGELLTFNETEELEKNGLTDGSIIILVGCRENAVKLNDCKNNSKYIDNNKTNSKFNDNSKYIDNNKFNSKSNTNTNSVDDETYYLHIIPCNIKSRKLLKLFSNSPLELFGCSDYKNEYNKLEYD